MEQTVQQPCHSMYSLSHVTDRESLDRAVDDEIKSDSYMSCSSHSKLLSQFQISQYQQVKCLQLSVKTHQWARLLTGGNEARVSQEAKR